MPTPGTIGLTFQQVHDFDDDFKRNGYDKHISRIAATLLFLTRHGLNLLSLDLTASPTATFITVAQE